MRHTFFLNIFFAVSIASKQNCFEALSKGSIGNGILDIFRILVKQYARCFNPPPSWGKTEMDPMDFVIHYKWRHKLSGFETSYKHHVSNQSFCMYSDFHSDTQTVPPPIHSVYTNNTMKTEICDFRKQIDCPDI